MQGMDPVTRFRELVAADDVDVAEAALAIAEAGDPPVDRAWCLAELERLAAGVRDLDSLRGALFGPGGFAGNTADYADPRNSFLHRVLQRRLGIPITLSLVVLEVGRRAGVALEPVSMPGHFLVRHPATGWYVDAFGGGALLDGPACMRLLQATTGAVPPAVDEALLPVVGPHDVLRRTLANLQEVYRARGAASSLEWVLRMRLALPAIDVADALELGTALASQGRVLAGAVELERLGQAHPHLADELLRGARSLRAVLN
jgi:regulator of sirC expression with transglutaminase-like and TPR domain